MAKIKMDADQVEKLNKSFSDAGAQLTVMPSQADASGLSGMPAGKRFAELSDDIFQLLQLYKQLIDKNYKLINDMKNDFVELDKKLSI